MINLKRFIIVILLLSFILTIFSVTSFATNINMNLAQEQNVTSRQNTINDIENNTNVEDELSSLINSTSSNTTLNTNTVATVQTVEQFEDTTSGFDITNVINILLLAVGLVIILLAVAILIRLKK